MEGHSREGKGQGGQRARYYIGTKQGLFVIMSLVLYLHNIHIMFEITKLYAINRMNFFVKYSILWYFVMVSQAS